MSKCQSGVDILCPFYKKHDGRSVTCEGILPDTNVAHRFCRVSECDIQVRVFCGEHYRNCEAYQAILHKYKEEDAK